MSLKDKVAWITGGGSGIGLAGAMGLAEAGAHVVISGRTAATNASALKQVRAEGSAEVLQLEVSDRKAVAAAAKDVLGRHRRIDILINSAGTNLGKRNLHNMSAEGWDEVVAINLSGLFYCCHAVLPAMRAQKDGLIINVSSWAGRYASTLTGPAYNATKRAVIALSESINAEECIHGIRATSVLPGEVATRSWRSARCRRRRRTAKECCRRRTSARPSSTSPACRRGPASTSSSSARPGIASTLVAWRNPRRRIQAASFCLKENSCAACCSAAAASSPVSRLPAARPGPAGDQVRFQDQDPQRHGRRQSDVCRARPR